MLKKLGIFCVIAICLIGICTMLKTGRIQLPVSDTIDIQTKETRKTGMQLLPLIQKMDLKIFLSTLLLLSNGISTEQLNPLAISFVEDYIGKVWQNDGGHERLGKALF